MLSGSGGFADASPQPLCLTAVCELSCWALLGDWHQDPLPAPAPGRCCRAGAGPTGGL